MHTTEAKLVHKYDSPSGQVSYLKFQVDETFTFAEGQFVMIEAEIDGHVIKRAYSIATTNRELQVEKLIGSIVKKASESGMSDYLTQKIQLGDRVIVKGPLGHFVDDKRYNKYLFVSVGSGLSPNFGMFKHLVYESQDYSTIVNIFGERFYNHIIPEVEEVFTQHGQENIYNYFHLSKEEELPTGYHAGYVQASLEQALRTLGTDISCFLCGKPVMVDDVRKQLEDMGITKEQITFEKY